MQRDLPTVCVLCSHNCGIRVDVDGGKIVAVRADDRNPITSGYVCNKAFSLAHYVDHKQRVQHPLRRRPDGTFERVGWDEAIADIGARLARARDQHGGKSIAMVGVGGQGNHLDGIYALSFLYGLGSPWWFNSLAQEKTQHALVDGWMFGASPSVYLHPDAERSQYLLVMGTNPAVSNRGRNATELLKLFKHDQARTLVVVDPRHTQSARGADEHVAVRPGTDVYFMIGLAAHIVRAGLHDQAFLRARTVGLERVEALLRQVDPAEMAARAGVPAEQLVRVAEGFARAESAGIFSDLGVEQVPFSTLNSYLMRLLQALTGNLGNRGGAVFHGTFSPNIPRADRKPHRSASGIEAIAMLAPVGMFSPNLLPEEILCDRPDRIRAVIVEGANPMLQAADTARQRAAFESLDLLVVIDPAMTETARLAHYVLPTPVGYEKWEYAGFPRSYPEIHAQLRPPVVAPPAEALVEAEIYARLARAAGVVEATPRSLAWLAPHARTQLGAAGYLAAAFAQGAARGRSVGGTLARVTFWTHDALGPHLPAANLTGIWLQSHLFAVTRRKELQRSLPGATGEALFQALLDHPEGVEIARTDAERNLADNITFRDGKIRLAPEQMVGELRRALAAPAAPDLDYPLLLNGGARTHWNANTIHRDPAWRKGQGPHCAVSMSPADAERLGIADGASVTVETRRGAVRLPAVVDATVQPGNVLIPNGFGTEYPDPVTGELVRVGVGINALTDAADRDPFTGCPYHKVVHCRVRPVSLSQ